MASDIPAVARSQAVEPQLSTKAEWLEGVRWREVRFAGFGGHVLRSRAAIVARPALARQ